MCAVKIAVCSDIHDNLQALDLMLSEIDKADCLLFCGDLNAPFTFEALVEGFHGPVHTIWGNNDGDRWYIGHLAHQVNNVTLHGEFAELELDGYRIAMTHYPRIAWAVAHADLYDLVCYGHDHQKHHERIGETMLLNPGELMGRFGPPSYALVDSITADVVIRELTSN